MWYVTVYMNGKLIDDGHVFDTLYDICEYYDVCRKTLFNHRRRRIKKRGLSYRVERLINMTELYRESEEDKLIDENLGLSIDDPVKI